MKKVIAISLTLCILLSGCVSQDDFDAVVAERDALQANNTSLQAEKDSLQAACDAQQETLDKYSDIIGAMDTEDYATAMSIISEKQIAKEIAEKGDIEEYLVTVELTVDNFDDYFEWKSFYNLNSFGEDMEESVTCVPVSKVYDEGLILYDTDVKIGYTFSFSFLSSGRTHSESVEETREWSRSWLPSIGCGSSQGTKFLLEKCQVDVNRVLGTVTFVKSDYVTDYELGEIQDGASQTALITLVNGEQFTHSIQFGCMY